MIKTYTVGQGIVAKPDCFRDGAPVLTNRPFLIVDVKEDYIGILGVSSSLGKEKQVSYPSNRNLKEYSPPFRNPSFVKLDSYIKVEKSNSSCIAHLCDSGAKLNQEDLSFILRQYIKY